MATIVPGPQRDPLGRALGRAGATIGGALIERGAQKREDVKQTERDNLIRKILGIEDPAVAGAAVQGLTHPATGRPLQSIGDGKFESERSITVQHPSINAGQPTNIPSIFGGETVTEAEAIANIVDSGGVDPETGRALPSFPSIPEAEAAAIQRSDVDLRLPEGFGAPKKPTIEQQIGVVALSDLKPDQKQLLVTQLEKSSKQERVQTLAKDLAGILGVPENVINQAPDVLKMLDIAAAISKANEGKDKVMTILPVPGPDGEKRHQLFEEHPELGLIPIKDSVPAFIPPAKEGVRMELTTDSNGNPRMIFFSGPVGEFLEKGKAKRREDNLAAVKVKTRAFMDSAQGFGSSIEKLPSEAIGGVTGNIIARAESLAQQLKNTVLTAGLPLPDTSFFEDALNLDKFKKIAALNASRKATAASIANSVAAFEFSTKAAGRGVAQRQYEQILKRVEPIVTGGSTIQAQTAATDLLQTMLDKLNRERRDLALEEITAEDIIREAPKSASFFQSRVGRPPLAPAPAPLPEQFTPGRTFTIEEFREAFPDVQIVPPEGGF